MEETYFSTKKITGQVQRVIAPRTAEALTLFCSQSKEFTQAVEQSGKTFQECLDSIAKGINKNGAVSDFDVFKAAAEYYFKGAVIHFDMRIDLGEGDEPAESVQPESKTLSISLDDFLSDI